MVKIEPLVLGGEGVGRTAGLTLKSGVQKISLETFSPGELKGIKR